MEAPGAAAAGARAAWSKIRHAAANVAAYERLHLYRGELWTRGIVPPDGLECAEFGEADLDRLPPAERTALLERLELDEAYCREKWRRGDLVVLARLHGRAAGIAWCARTAVPVPEIGRDIRPGPYECYIHDVYVPPDARGKNVAPAMLEDLARRLRQRDVYRAWALIEASNVASTRAFEKAAYAAVADVIYAKMAVMDRIVLRPPDPEGKRLLGIP
jgi:GNAT superfamily N-acetyltransferase